MTKEFCDHYLRDSILNHGLPQLVEKRSPALAAKMFEKNITVRGFLEERSDNNLNLLGFSDKDVAAFNQAARSIANQLQLGGLQIQHGGFESTKELDFED